MVALCADAAEKQSGEYILDRAYVLSLSDKAIETAQAMIYDLNVLTGDRYAGLYDAAESIRHRATALFKEASTSLSSQGEKEEPEYRLLRNMREMLFAEKSMARPDEDSSRVGLFGVVQSVQKAAGDSLAALMRSSAAFPFSAETHGSAIPEIKTSVMDLMKGLSGSDGSSLLSDPFSIDSAPTREFLTAFFSPEFWKGRSHDPADPDSAVLVACGLEESMNAEIFQGEGYRLFDAFLSCAPEANYIYCRLRSDAKASVAAGILEKLGFFVSSTQDELTGWISSQPLNETAAKLKATAKMAAFLLQSRSESSGSRVEEDVNRFIRMID
jgi:hypothetical protein